MPMSLVNKKLTSFLLLVFWMIIIFSFSHTPNLNLGSGIISLEIIVRKLAHLGEYFVLAVLFWIFLKNNFIKLNKKQIFYYSILFVLIFAVSDEVHQAFIVGRAGKIEDVIFDLLSGLLGIFLIERLGFFHKIK